MPQKTDLNSMICLPEKHNNRSFCDQGAQCDEEDYEWSDDDNDDGYRRLANGIDWFDQCDGEELLMILEESIIQRHMVGRSSLKLHLFSTLQCRKILRK